MLFAHPASASEISGEWNEIVTCDFYEFLAPIGTNITPQKLDSYVLPFLHYDSYSYNYAWIGIPLTGDSWQIDPSKQFEIRMIINVQENAVPDNFEIDCTPQLNGFNSQWWYSSQALPEEISDLTAKDVTSSMYSRYKTFYYGSDKIESDQITSTDIPINYMRYNGCIVDIVIKDGFLPADARFLYIPFRLATRGSQSSWGISYASVRNIKDDELDILKDILAYIQTIAGGQGMSPQQVTDAVLEALDQFEAQEQTKASSIKGQAERAVEDVIDAVRAEEVHTFLTSLSDIATSTSEQDMVLSTQPFTMDGTTLIPSIEWNITKAVRDMLNKTKTEYAAINDVLGIIASIVIVNATIILFKKIVMIVISCINADFAENDLPDETIVTVEPTAKDYEQMRRESSRNSRRGIHK